MTERTELTQPEDGAATKMARRLAAALAALAVAGAAFSFGQSDVLTRSKEALYTDGGTVASKGLRDVFLGGGFYLDIDPKGSGLRRVRVEVGEDEWNGTQVGDAFPARSEAAKREAGLSDDLGAREATKDVGSLMGTLLVCVAVLLLAVALVSGGVHLAVFLMAGAMVVAITVMLAFLAP